MKLPARRILLIVLAVLVGGGALFVALRPAAVRVETALVTRGRFVATVEEDGRTRVRDRYLVSAPVAGRVLRLPVRAGDPVTLGQPVATILSAPADLLSGRTRAELEERLGTAEATLNQAGAWVVRASNQQSQAEAEATRTRALHARGVASPQQLERDELALQMATRDLQAATHRHHALEHELAQVRAALRRSETLNADPDRHTVTAPVDGRVLRVLRESEAVVASGAPLLEIGDPADLEIVVDVLTTQAVAIVPGASVAIPHWGGAEPLEGRVRLVEPGAFTKVSALGVEEQRVLVVIDITSQRERWQSLGDGFRVDTRITTATVDDAVIVPVGALFRRGAAWAVFVVDGGVARERPVGISRIGERMAVVEANLAVGGTVVLFPASALHDGARVREAR